MEWWVPGVLKCVVHIIIYMLYMVVIGKYQFVHLSIIILLIPETGYI